MLLRIRSRRSDAVMRGSMLGVTLALVTSLLMTVAPVAVLAAGQQALQLNGSSQYATLGSTSQLRSATFTVELWFKRTGAGVATSTGSGGITNAIPLITKGRAEAETASRRRQLFPGDRRNERQTGRGLRRGPDRGRPRASTTRSRPTRW